MKSLKFLHLLIQDFKSFLGEHQLKLDLSLGVWFIRGLNKAERALGSNGSGKSSLWDALCWCLYGVTPGGLRNPDVRPWRGANGRTKVSLILMVGKERHVISRTASPNSLKLNGKDVGPEAIEKLLGMTFEVMTNTIILGQGRPLFFDLKPAEKMDMLTEVKQLDRWDGRSIQAGARARELEAELATVEGELTGLSSGTEQIEEGLAAVAKEEAQWRKDNERQVRSRDKAIRIATKKLARLDSQIATADLRYDGAMTEVRACETQVSKLGLEVSNLRSKLTQRQQNRAAIKHTISQFKERLKKLAVATRCPTCGQAVIQHNFASHRKELKDGLATWEVKLADLKTKALKKMLDTAGSNLAHEKKYLDSFHAKADGAMSTLKSKQGQAADLRAELASLRRIERTNPHTQLLRDARKRLRQMKEDLEDATIEKQSIERELVRAKFWVKGFRDIKLHVIEELLQELEITTAGMLEEVGLVGWEIKYLIERTTKKGKVHPGLTILIKSPRSKGLVKWESWSGGEGQRLRIVGALSLASVLLNHAGVEPSIEVLDEPTQHLSDEGVYDLCDFLVDRAKRTGRTIFYADQQSVDSARFAGTITVRRGKGGSTVKRATP